MAAPLPQLAGLPPQQQQPPPGALREISPVFLCRIGQETVQDIVTRTMEIFQITRATQLPNGVTQSHAVYQDRFGKLQEHLRQLALLFRKLRLLYERCVEMTSDLQEIRSLMMQVPADASRGQHCLSSRLSIISLKVIDLIDRQFSMNSDSLTTHFTPPVTIVTKKCFSLSRTPKSFLVKFSVNVQQTLKV
uniref:Mediator of RNA polymerase II transcription subunit 30 n=1 Tax=Poecilia mexicana TaxID=48701 RepID=A0A3B3WUL2_9TELE